MCSLETCISGPLLQMVERTLRTVAANRSPADVYKLVEGVDRTEWIRGKARGMLEAGVGGTQHEQLVLDALASVASQHASLSLSTCPRRPLGDPVI